MEDESNSENLILSSGDSDLGLLDFEIDRRDFIASGLALGVVTAIPAVGRTARSEKPSPPPTPSESMAIMPVEIKMKVNGEESSLKLDPRTTLLDALREHLELTGAKKGCDHGQCGACNVLVNGRRINSCLSLAAQNNGKEIITIEGLAKGDELHPLQKAFIEHDAFQCGYCTPGQILSAVALMKEPCGASEAEVRECMSGNICRCGAYRGIMDAITEVRGKGGGHAAI